MPVLIPLNSGQLLCPTHAAGFGSLSGLNPFEFRAVTLSPLDAAQREHDIVLIPLNSGQLLCPSPEILMAKSWCLNPFEFRAVTLSLHTPEPKVLDKS